MDFQRIIGGLLGGSGDQPGGAPGRPGRLGALLSGGGGGGSLTEMLGRLRPPSGGAVGAAAAGGLLGSVLGGRRGGGLLRTGGMAAVGLLAYRAYEQWKAQQAGNPATPSAAEFAQVEEPAFGLSLVRAMVAAARADGDMDSAERERIFGEAERLNLDADDKAEMFRILDTPADPAAIARLAVTEAQKAEIYTASALIIGKAGASERAYLVALAGVLDLPAGLRARLDAEVQAALITPPV